MAAAKVELIYLALVWFHAAQGISLDWNNVEKTMFYGIEKRIYPGKLLKCFHIQFTVDLGSCG